MVEFLNIRAQYLAMINIHRVITQLGIMSIALTLLVSQSHGDIIRLKTGKTVQGVITGDDGDTLSVRTEVGVMSIPKSVIITMEKESPAMNQIRAGDSYVARGEWDKARAQYEAALQIDPKLMDAKTKLADVLLKIEAANEEKLKPMFQEGDRLLDKGQYQAAVQSYTDLLNHNPAGDFNKSIKRRLANAYYLWGKDRLEHTSKYEAADNLKKAISYDGSYAKAHFLLADISKDLANREEDAIQYYSTGLRLEPSRYQSQFNRGEIYVRTNQLQQAIDDFLVVYQKDTSGMAKSAAEKLMICYWNMGKMDFEKQLLTDAISNYEKSIQYKSDSAMVYYDLAKAYSQDLDYDKVIAILTKAITLDTRFVDAYILLGDTYMALEKYNDAVTPYRRAILIQPENYKLLCNLSEAYIYRGQYDDALDFANRAVKVDGNLAPGHYVLGMVLEKKEMNQDAFTELKKAADIATDDPKIHLELGRVYKKLKQYDQALAEYQNVLKVNPQLPTAHNEMGLVNMALGNYFNAISDFQKSIENDSTFIQGYINLGDAYRLKQNYDSAIDIYQRAIKINPNFPDSYLGLGMVAHDYQKDFASAKKYYQSYLDHGGKMNDQLGQWMKEIDTLQSPAK